MDKPGQGLGETSGSSGLTSWQGPLQPDWPQPREGPRGEGPRSYGTGDTPGGRMGNKEERALQGALFVVEEADLFSAWYFSERTQGMKKKKAENSVSF